MIPLSIIVLFCTWILLTKGQRQVTCGRLSNPFHGEVVHSGYTVGSSASYTCFHGFRLKGLDQRICRRIGLWSGKAPVCEKNCDERSKFVDHGGVTFEHFDPLNVHVGMKATYFCNVGYVIAGSPVSVCLGNGSWTEPPPHCTIETCPTLSIVDGIVNATGNKPGSIATYTCGSNMILQGNNERTCGKTGEWSGHKPTCISKEFALQLQQSGTSELQSVTILYLFLIQLVS